MLNGSGVVDHKVSAFLARLRERFALPPLHISSSNNFPTGAGLASSASGFAALVTAINGHAGLGLNSATISALAREGSASAARSLYGGFVGLSAPDWQAVSLAPAAHWPLRTVVAIVSDAAKAVSSSEGMEVSRRTSPFYGSWLEGGEADYAAAATAIEARDFAALTRVAELSCLKMHSVMLTSTPTLAYWREATLSCMDTVRKLRADGAEVFFTIDAGPQVKAVCLPQFSAAVAEALAGLPGVQRVLTCDMGGPASVIHA